LVARIDASETVQTAAEAVAVTIDEALDASDPSVLRLALYQATRDPELAAMKLNRVPMRGGAFYAYVVDEVHVPAIKQKVRDFLVRKEAAPVAELRNDDVLRETMGLLTGRAVNDVEFRLGKEELAFDPHPRAARWTNERPPETDRFRVAIIGAGFSGIAAAVQMQHLGIPFEIYERMDDVSGTWHANQYPDARVDTSSFLYQFKFIKNYPWPEYYAPQGEVKKYLEHIIQKYDLRKHITFNTTLDRAVFDEESNEWELELTGHQGPYAQRVNAVISAAGQFSTARKPDVEGVDDFRGDFFHTSRWPADYDPAGRRIAVIGNGSTGVQLMPRLAQKAAQLYQIQRTPQWISPFENYRAPITPEHRWMFDHFPGYWNWYCYYTYVTALGMEQAQEYDREWMANGGIISRPNDAIRTNTTEYIRSKVGSRPDLLQKLIPDYAPMQDNVELVTDAIERFDDTGIQLDNGRRLEVDTVVFAGGFQVGKYLFPAEYVGRDGNTIEKLWSVDGPRAYLGMTLPDFPNMFIFYGPNSQPRSGSFMGFVELWSRYTGQALVRLIEGRHEAVEVKREVFNNYNRELDEGDAALIWKNEGPPGRNYYIYHGRQVVNPSVRNIEYFSMVEEFDPDHFEFR